MLVRHRARSLAGDPAGAGADADRAGVADQARPAIGAADGAPDRSPMPAPSVARADARMAARPGVPSEAPGGRGAASVPAGPARSRGDGLAALGLRQLSPGASRGAALYRARRAAELQLGLSTRRQTRPRTCDCGQAIRGHLKCRCCTRLAGPGHTCTIPEGTLQVCLDCRRACDRCGKPRYTHPQGCKARPRRP